MLRRSGLLLAALALLMTGFASPASAAVEVGDDCVANVAEGPYSLVPVARADGGPLAIAPTAGVATRWRVSSDYPDPVPQRLGVFRPTGAAGQFRLVGESNEELPVKGTSSFATRIPVQAGDLFGPIAVINDTLFCSTGNAGDKAWGFAGSVGIGAAHTYMATTEVRIPMIVTIEPDKDGDGFGDETQDQCPQLPSAQGTCPLVAVDALATALKGAVSVLVTTNAEAPVTVSGSVKLAQTKKGKGKAKSSASLELTPVTQTVSPGTIAAFTLKFPSLLKSQLRALPPSRSLKLQVTATARNAAGQPTAKVTTVKLKGQKRPRRKG